jgi:hypothetical protein
LKHYSSLPDEITAKGAMTFAAYPPLEGDYLTCRLHDRFLPGWRQHAADPIEATPELQEKILKQMRPMMDAVERRNQVPGAEPDARAEERHVLKVIAHRNVDRWRLF